MKINKTVKKVTHDVFERNSFNTAIAAIMELLNNLTKYHQHHNSTNDISLNGIKIILKMLSPFAPHITQKIWTDVGETSILMQESWPEVNDSALEESKKEIIIQINGKLRGKLIVNVELDKDEITKLVLQDQKLKTYLVDSEIKKVIHVKGKLVNYVI